MKIKFELKIVALLPFMATKIKLSILMIFLIFLHSLYQEF